MEEKQRLHPDAKTGLTSQQVASQKEKGLKNEATEKISKSTGQIIKDNVCTLFNLFNLIIAIALACVGAFSNLLFIVIIIANILIAIIQELRAKKLVDSLSLLSVPHAKVIRDGKEREVPVEDLVLDDVICLYAGQQICSDAIILEGEAEVNESLLTGESDPINKVPGDQVLSGSFVISGKCYAKVEHVGNDNYATHIAHEAKKMKQVHSELVTSMRKVTRFTGFLIIPLGIVLFLEAFFLRGGDPTTSVVSTAAGLLGMLPKGLVLLISISLAVGVGRLAKRKVLVQELYSLETLAHVDVLCLDKTGTITEGNMKVETVYPLRREDDIAWFDDVMGSFLHYTDDNNATFQAIKGYYQECKRYAPVQKIPFSSQRKWSAMTFEQFGTLVLGAPERLTNSQLPEEIQLEIQNGNRVILVGMTKDNVTADGPLTGVVPLKAIVITDPIRENAKATFDYFKREGVAIKVISGDNPATVAAIAQKAGLEGAENYIDMSTIQTKEELVKAANRYSVFGRVSPQQKKMLVEALQKHGHKVAMTGDGVNDILALREADCSIAIAEGSDAARQVSQLVLLNSDFSSLPQVLAEGRRVVNNITRVAGVFFVKTIYSVLLSIICICTNQPFPFLPIQITLIDLAIEGYPAFFMSFEPDGRKVTGRFLPSVFRRAIPNAVATTIGVVALFLIAPLFGVSPEQTNTIMYLLVGFVGITAVFKACCPFNPLRGFLFLSMTFGYFAAAYIFKGLLELTMPSRTALLIFVIAAAASIVIERIIALITNAIFKNSMSNKKAKRYANQKR